MLNYSKEILLTQSLSGTVINSYAPFTLTVNPSAIDGITKKIYRIDYIFSDTDKIYQTWFYTASTLSDLPYLYDVGDPRNYKKSHTFYLPNVLKKEYTINCKIYQSGLSNVIQIPFTVSLSAPKMEGTTNAVFSSMHLVYTRMFGADNNILYVFETQSPRYYIPMIFNWKTRPIPPEVVITEEGYRPWDIFEPWEDQRLSNAYLHIDFFNEQGSYDSGNYPVPPVPPPVTYYLNAGNAFNSVTDRFIDEQGNRIII